MPENKEKIVFFDFCGTLVPFQSAPRYINFVVNNDPHKAAKIRRKIRDVLEKWRVPKRLEHYSRGFFTQKEIELWPLKGYRQDELDNAAKRFYKEEIKPNLIPEVMKEYHRYQKEGYRIVLVSGGFGIYLKYFAAEHGIAANDIISSNVQIKRGKATGKLEGMDCMGHNKITLLEQRFVKTKIYSEALSDSYSDIPMLKWANRGIVVSPVPTWNQSFDMDIIYYKESC